MNALTPEAPAPPLGLTRFEIIVHGLVDGLSLYWLANALWRLVSPFESHEGWTGVVIQAALVLLVVPLSLVIMTRRFRPERLRVLELGLSGLVMLAGVIGAVATLALMISGANYKGPSLDAGGMAMFSGLAVFYPCAALIVLPLAMNNSRLSDKASRRVGWLTGALALLPICVLLVIRALA